MSHLFAAQALAKWGTKQAWREELAALWFYAPDPQRPYTPKPPSVKRGRAGNHAALVEQVYMLLQEHRAGADVIVKIGDLATATGAHRRTVSSILWELKDAKRIEWRRLGQYGGLVVSFLDVIYSSPVEAVSAQQDAPNDVAAAMPEETKDVFLQEAARDHISQPQPPALEQLAQHYLSRPATAIGWRHVNEHTGVVVYRRSA
jgi:hypothetical protein